MGCKGDEGSEWTQEWCCHGDDDDDVIVLGTVVVMFNLKCSKYYPSPAKSDSVGVTRPAFVRNEKKLNASGNPLSTSYYNSDHGTTNTKNDGYSPAGGFDA